jgi:homocysteine S-methyltransferase
MPAIPFLTRLKDDSPLLADGAMGTLLHAHGAALDSCFDAQNLTKPELIESLHRAYIDAGAELIETNTFGANRLRLEEHGLEDQVAAINAAGVARARAAIAAARAADRVYIAGAIGPLGAGIQPYGRLKPEDARAIFDEQIRALVGSGVDVLLFETFTSLDEIVAGVEAARAAAPGTPIIAHMTFTRDDRTVSGHLPGAVARRLLEAGADVIGVNCSGGPAQIARVLLQMREAAPGARFSAMPNAGFPYTVGGRTMYPATTDYFADNALLFRAIGACVVGGCCGTTPDHIAAMRAAIDDPARPLPPLPQVSIRVVSGEDAAPERPSELANRLSAESGFLFSVEMNPPRSHNLDRMIDSASLLRDAGADVLNIADSPTARMRVSPWAACSVLQNRLGLETILHFPVRGRNMLRVQGDLLGAHALSIRNVFVVMGDPTRIGDYPEAMDQYDIVPSGLIRLIKHRLNQGVDQAGNSIGQPTSFTIGCALNMGADDPDKEIDVLRKKIDAGADFALGQPVFEPGRVEAFLARYQAITGEALRLPVLLGVMPLYSLRHATFLNNEVPGISIPQAVLKRIEDAGDDAPAEGVRIATEMLLAIRQHVRGAYIIPAFGRYDLAAQIIEAVRVR